MIVSSLHLLHIITHCYNGVQPEFIRFTSRCVVFGGALDFMRQPSGEDRRPRAEEAST